MSFTEKSEPEQTLFSSLIIAFLSLVSISKVYSVTDALIGRLLDEKTDFRL